MSSAAAVVFVCPVSRSCPPFRSPAQSFNLRDLLTDFLRDGITLVRSAPGIAVSEPVAHFIGDDSPQFLALAAVQQPDRQPALVLPARLVVRRLHLQLRPEARHLHARVRQLRPDLRRARRHDRQGQVQPRHRTTATSPSTTSTTSSLRDGDLRLVFTHQDINHDGPNVQPFFEGDVITAQLFLKIRADITAFVLTYGVTDRFDIGVAIPIVQRLDRRADGCDHPAPRHRGQSRHPHVRGRQRPASHDHAVGQRHAASATWSFARKYRFTSSPKFGFALGDGRAAADRRRARSARDGRPQVRALHDRFGAPRAPSPRTSTRATRGPSTRRTSVSVARRDQLHGRIRLGALARGSRSSWTPSGGRSETRSRSRSSTRRSSRTPIRTPRQPPNVVSADVPAPGHDDGEPEHVARIGRASGSIRSGICS